MKCTYTYCYIHFTYIEWKNSRHFSICTFNSSRVKSDGKLQVLAGRESSDSLPKVNGESATLQELVGRGKRGGAVTDVGESDGARDNQTVDHIAKVQMMLW